MICRSRLSRVDALEQKSNKSVNSSLSPSLELSRLTIAYYNNEKHSQHRWQLSRWDVTRKMPNVNKHHNATPIMRSSTVEANKAYKTPLRMKVQMQARGIQAALFLRNTGCPAMSASQTMQAHFKHHAYRSQRKRSMHKGHAAYAVQAGIYLHQLSYPAPRCHGLGLFCCRNPLTFECGDAVRLYCW